MALRLQIPIPAKPAPSSSKEVGSGTDVPLPANPVARAPAFAWHGAVQAKPWIAVVKPAAFAVRTLDALAQVVPPVAASAMERLLAALVYPAGPLSEPLNPPNALTLFTAPPLLKVAGPKPLKNVGVIVPTLNVPFTLKAAAVPPPDIKKVVPLVVNEVNTRLAVVFVN